MRPTPNGPMRQMADRQAATARLLSKERGDCAEKDRGRGAAQAGRREAGAAIQIHAGQIRNATTTECHEATGAATGTLENALCRYFGGASSGGGGGGS